MAAVVHKLVPKHQAEGCGVQREAGVHGTSLVLRVQSPGQLAVESMYRQAVQQVQARWQLPWCPAALAMLHDTGSTSKLPIYVILGFCDCAELPWVC